MLDKFAEATQVNGAHRLLLPRADARHRRAGPQKKGVTPLRERKESLLSANFLSAR